MNILILNWRDIRNPKSGGAEILTHELAARMVKKGHKVTQFSARFRGAKKKEVIDGVTIVRDGKPDVRHFFSSVHYKAYRYYHKFPRCTFDIVVDEVHGIPFFTPLYVREQKVALICEVAGNIWDIAFSFPLNVAGKLIERLYPLFYQSVEVATISKSSRDELQGIGFKSNKITILSLGCNVPVISTLKKKVMPPRLIFVSRLTKSKGIEDAIVAVSLIKKSIPNIGLDIIGRGEDRYVEALKKRVKKLDLEKNISFLGFVDEREKWRLLERAHVLLAPSSKEGWGLTIHEAGSRGTPAVGYTVEGLQDVIVDGKNGYLCKKNTPEILAKNVLKLLGDKKLYEKMRKGSIEERKKYTWSRTAKEFMDIFSK